MQEAPAELSIEQMAYQMDVQSEYLNILPRLEKFEAKLEFFDPPP